MTGQLTQGRLAPTADSTRTSPTVGPVALSAVPLTENCRPVLEARQHAVLAISPFNGYYKRSRIVDLVSWASKTFITFDVLVPGAADSAFALVGVGYPPEIAVAKATATLASVRRRVQGVMRELGLAEEPDQQSAAHPANAGGGNSVRENLLTDRDRDVLALTAQGLSHDEIAARLDMSLRAVGKHAVRATARLGERRPRVLTWTQLADRKTYQAQRCKAVEYFETDPGFRDACLEVCRVYLGMASAGRVAPTAAQMRMAAPCFLAEIPFFADSPAIFDVPSSVFCYHRVFPFVEPFFARELGYQSSACQGFAVVTPDTAEPVLPEDEGGESR